MYILFLLIAEWLSANHCHSLFNLLHLGDCAEAVRVRWGTEGVSDIKGGR